MQERVEHTKQTIEDKHSSSLKALWKLEKDYIVIGKERSDVDKHIVKCCAQAVELQCQVSHSPDIIASLPLSYV